MALSVSRIVFANRSDPRHSERRRLRRRIEELRGKTRQMTAQNSKKKLDSFIFV
jgi:hypothetical protein